MKIIVSVKKTQQQISPSINELLFKLVELDRNNNFKSRF